MTRQIALAYAVAGLSIAVALVAVTGSTIGLLSRSEAPVASTPEGFTLASVDSREWQPDPKRSRAADLWADGGEPLADVVPEEVEYVYVDEPAPSGRDGRDHDDHDDDDDDHDDDHHGRSRHDDDARGHRDHHAERDDD